MYGLALGRAGAEQPNSIQNAALGILRLYGTDAHVYLPGAGGVAVSGLPSNNYTLSDGSTGYSAVDGTAGLVLDGAGVSSQTVPLIDTFTFTAAGSTPPTASSSDTFLGSACVSVTMPANTGGYSVCRADGSGGAARHTITAGRFIQYTYTVALSRLLTGGERVKIYSTGQNGSSELFLLTSASPENTWIDGASSMVAGATGDNYPAVMSDSVISAPVTVYLRQYSVKQVTGIHATQSTTANKPALRRGLYNLLTYSNDLSNAAWVSSNITTIAGVLKPNANSTVHVVENNWCTISGGVATTAAVVSANGYTKVGIRESKTTGYWSVFDLNLGVVVSQYVSTTNVDIVGIGGGKYLITQTVSGATLQGCAVHVIDDGYVSGSPNNYSFSGDTVSGVAVHAVGVFKGTLTAAQILKKGGIPLTTSVAASNPVAGPYFWDTTGGKSLGMTFDASWTSATIIDAAQTGQSTLTAQNIVGAYSISTNTSGRIFINGSLSAADLATLQSFANMIAAA